MKFMVIVKANADTEAGVMPTSAQLAEMGRFNEELARAGVLLAGEGLHPSSRGARIVFDGDRRSVVDGPFAEAKELVAGFWIIEVSSKQEAVEWMRRCPNPYAGSGGRGDIEIRQIFAAEDFGDALTPELRAQEQALRDQAAAR